MHIKLTRKDAQHVKVENNGAGKSVEVFHFLERCRKSGVTRLVSFGDHGWGSNGSRAIRITEVESFQLLALQAGLIADFAGSEAHKEYLHAKECEGAAIAVLAERSNKRAA